MYLYGSTFNLITDHKALEIIFRYPQSKPPARIEWWFLRLQQYDFIVTYRPGDGNPADYLSRHPESNRLYKEEYICYVAMHAVPKAMTLEEIISATQTDPTLQAVKVCLQSGTWHTSKHLFPNANHNDLNSFEKLKTELTEPSAGLMLRGIRTIIPQTRSVQLAHEGHQGIVKTKTAKTSGFQESTVK
jgi:hypothetical protein